MNPRTIHLSPSRLCPGCHHPTSWHQVEEPRGVNLPAGPVTDPGCLGYDPDAVDDEPGVCDCPALVREGDAS